MSFFHTFEVLLWPPLICIIYAFFSDWIISGQRNILIGCDTLTGGLYFLQLIVKFKTKKKNSTVKKFAAITQKEVLQDW
jgi:hypothetical protein